MFLVEHKTHSDLLSRPCRVVLSTSGPSWTASSASSRRTRRAKRRAWPTCASSSRTASTRCWPRRSCTYWAKRAPAPPSPPSTSASSSTEWCWRARLFVQVRRSEALCESRTVFMAFYDQLKNICFFFHPQPQSALWLNLALRMMISCQASWFSCRGTCVL